MFHVKNQNKVNNLKIGSLGESIAAKYLKNKGFLILERNYRKPYGEIDIVARGTIKSTQIETNNVSYETLPVVHFVEVKTVSYETVEEMKRLVSHETWRPEEKVNDFKLGQIKKAAESWIFEHNWAGEVQVDVVAIRMVPREKYASVKYIQNVL